MSLVTLRLSYYPDENDRDRKADYVVITALVTPHPDGVTSEVLAEMRAPYLTEPVEVSLPGLPAKPDLLLIGWAALSAFAVGAAAGDKEMVVSLRDKPAPPPPLKGSP